MGAAARVSGPLGRSVQEVLETLLSPAMSRQVLGDVLEAEGLERFPEDPVAAAELVEGPLRALVGELFGTDTASFVVKDLAPVLAMAESGVRSSRPTWDAVGDTARPVAGASDPYASPTQPILLDQPVGAEVEVLLATDATGVQDTLARSLRGLSPPRLVKDAFALFTALEMRRGPLWIVVDGFRPTADVATLGAFLGALPSDCRVILWGCDTDGARRLVAERAGWSAVEAGDHWGELGLTLCAMIRSAQQ